jgi:hypothetical protein
MKINITETHLAEVTRKDLGHALIGYILDLMGVDDPGCDYFTDEKCYTYMGNNPDALISTDMVLGSAIDTANFLMYGHWLKLEH